MAIILAGKTGIEAAILGGIRPALLIRDRWISDDIPAVWQLSLSTKRDVIERAIYGTGRIDTSDGALPYLGTAFLIAPGLAITTKHVAVIIRRGLHENTSYWLNFKAEHDSSETLNVNVIDVLLMHPNLDFAVLTLEKEVEPERILSFTTEPLPTGSDVCVIGYPSSDVRNDQDVQARIFGSIYGVKRLMPGKVTGYRPSREGQDVSLAHDATTLGGTAGAPVVDLNTGRVAGIVFGGMYLYTNWAVPTEKLTGLAKFLSLGIPGARVEEPPPVIGGPVKPKLVNIFSFDEILNLHQALIGAEFYKDGALQGLFYGLPLEFQASLPNAETNNEKLLARLQYLNRFGSLIDFENHTPFYVVLKTAKAQRSADPNAVAIFDNYIARIIAAEAQARNK